MGKIHRCETDTVVLGLGAMGSASLYHLALHGIPAIGIEQFALGHDRGSTHGPTRVFRVFYPDPLYIEMGRAAQAQWHALEQRIDRQLLTLCGQVILARPDNALWRQGVAALQTTRESHEVLTPAQIRTRFPMMHAPMDRVGCWVPRAGFLEPEAALGALVSTACQAGAEVLASQQVVGLDRQGDRMEVATADSRVLCRRLICTGGAWTAALLPDLALQLHVTRQQKFHFRSPMMADLQPGRLPVYGDYEMGFYGFPAWQDVLNVADDNWGDPVEPDAVDRRADPAVQQRMAQWVSSLFPDREWEHVHTETCLYTNTPDDDFILDRHPDLSRVAIGAGFSGHGFKFTPLIGQLLVQLVLDEDPVPDISALGLHAARNLRGTAASAA